MSLLDDDIILEERFENNLVESIGRKIDDFIDQYTGIRSHDILPVQYVYECDINTNRYVSEVALFRKYYRKRECKINTGKITTEYVSAPMTNLLVSPTNDSYLIYEVTESILFSSLKKIRLGNEYYIIPRCPENPILLSNYTESDIPKFINFLRPCQEYSDITIITKECAPLYNHNIQKINIVLENCSYELYNNLRSQPHLQIYTLQEYLNNLMSVQ